MIALWALMALTFVGAGFWMSIMTPLMLLSACLRIQICGLTVVASRMIWRVFLLLVLGFSLLSPVWLGMSALGDILMMFHWQVKMVVKGAAFFALFLAPLQSVQRADIWKVILALKACTPVFVGVDHKNVVNHVGQLLTGQWRGRPFPLVKDGDLLQFVGDILQCRDRNTVRICKVKGHATEDMVARGLVRRADLIGNNLADEAADLGRRRQIDRVSTARRSCVQACHSWYPLVLDLHRYFIAVARIAVNHDPGTGTARDPTVWCTGAPAKKPKLHEAVCEFAATPGPDDLEWRGWFCVHAQSLAQDDFDHWPYSTGPLIKFSAFLGSLNWSSGEEDLVMGGVSFIEVLIVYELWAGERLVLETALPKYQGRGRSITVAIASVAAETVIWRSCRFIGALFRPLRDLPCGLGRFIPGRIGGNHRRLLRIGWEQCGHGLSCRPRESRSQELLDALLLLFDSAGSLLVMDRSAPDVLVPFVLSGGAGGPGTGGAGGPMSGGAGGTCFGGAGCPLVHWSGGAGGSGWSRLAGGPGGCLKSGADGGTKRIRLTRKTPPSSDFSLFVAQPKPKRRKRLRTGSEEASLTGLALPQEVDGTSGSVTGFDRIGIG